MHSYLEACVLVEKQENYFLITHSYLETRFKFQAKPVVNYSAEFTRWNSSV